MSSGVYYAQYDVLGDRDLGDHEQIRYVQGDVDYIFINHGGKWHTVPRGGIVAGARAAMVLRSPMTHRSVDVTLEFGRRLVDGYASRPIHHYENDTVHYFLSPLHFVSDIDKVNLGKKVRRVVVAKLPDNERAIFTFIDAPKNLTIFRHLVNHTNKPKIDGIYSNLKSDVPFGNITSSASGISKITVPNLFYRCVDPVSSAFSTAIKRPHKDWNRKTFTFDDQFYFFDFGKIGIENAPIIEFTVQFLGRRSP